MRIGVTALSLSLAACGFAAPGANATDDVGPSDAPMGSEPTIGVDGPLADGRLPDAPVVDGAPPPFCAGTGLVTVCVPTAPTDDLSVSGTNSVLNSDSMCTKMQDVGGVSVCVMARHDITIPTGTYVRISGSHPIILFASGNIILDGQISASNHAGLDAPGASTANCTASRGEDNQDSGGGGGGGGFSDSGGGGGMGDGTHGDGGAAGVATARVLRAGCTGGRGGNGNAAGGGGGAGGGAIHLIAAGMITVSATGAITAVGDGGTGGHAEANYGGHSGGGGGGGSGGFIGFDAPSVTITGLLLATGGGGGEGASFNRYDGESGQVGALNASSRAAGGMYGTASGGDGGSGSGPGAPTPNRGAAGNGSLYGGGGGGGAAGFIYVNSNGTTVATQSASVSPSITN